MKFKKLLITGIALLGLVSVSGIGNANASHYGWWQTRSERRAHNSWVSGQVEWAEAHGYMKRPYHHRHTRYIIIRHHYTHHHRSGYYHYPKHLTRQQREDLKGRDDALREEYQSPKHMKSHFIRTNNKRLLRKSGYKLENFYGTKTIESNYYPNNKHAYIPKNLNLNDIAWENNKAIAIYNYQGHNNWKKY